MPDVRSGVDVLSLRAADHAAALRGEEVLVAAVRDEAADSLFAQTVVDRGVDEVDAGVEHTMEELLGLAVREGGAARVTAQLHRAEAEDCGFESGPSQRAFR
jgi:hypothetical protein